MEYVSCSAESDCIMFAHECELENAERVGHHLWKMHCQEKKIPTFSLYGNFVEEGWKKDLYFYEVKFTIAIVQIEQNIL